MADLQKWLNAIRKETWGFEHDSPLDAKWLESLQGKMMEAIYSRNFSETQGCVYQPNTSHTHQTKHYFDKKPEVLTLNLSWDGK